MWHQIEEAETASERFELAVCPECLGDGEVRGNASVDLDPQADDSKPCARCGGTGKP